MRREVEPVYNFSSFEKGDVSFITSPAEDISKQYRLRHPIEGYLYKITEQLAGEVYV